PFPLADPQLVESRLPRPDPATELGIRRLGYRIGRLLWFVHHGRAMAEAELTTIEEVCDGQRDAHVERLLTARRRCSHFTTRGKGAQQQNSAKFTDGRSDIHPCCGSTRWRR